MRRLTLFAPLALLALLTVLVIAPGLSPEAAVQAEHNIDQDDNGDSEVENHEKSNLLNGALNRNLIFGEAIGVCTMYPNATGDAVRNWHNKLRGAGFISLSARVFDIQGTG